MRAYKFKSAARADHIFDILLNQRLYCADWSILNDPMEAVFAYSCRQDSENEAHSFAAKVNAHLKEMRVCSLTGSFDCHLLWSHYADGFNGVAVEVELPDDHSFIRPINYRGVFGGYGYEANSDPEDTAAEIIFSKYQEWKYEQEIRICSNEEWFVLNRPILKVIAGHRLHPALFDTIQLVCEKQGITFCSVGIGDEGLDADWVPPLLERKRSTVGAA